MREELYSDLSQHTGENNLVQNYVCEMSHVTLSKNEKSRPVAGGPAEVAVSRRESTSGQAESNFAPGLEKSGASRW